MDAFESIVATILRLDGYWVHRLVRVPLTAQEKRRLGQPSLPRPELDLVAYKPRSNELLVVECKSFLDSQGVHSSGFTDPNAQSFKRYKLFNDPRLWRTVRRALVRHLRQLGACCARPVVRLCLTTGHIATPLHRLRLRAHFAKHRWELLDDIEIARRLRDSSDTTYADDVAIVAAKILSQAENAPSTTESRRPSKGPDRGR